MRCIAGHNSCRRREGFTLMELLTVLIIIGIIAVIGLPAIKGMAKSQNDISAQRQLLDDLARARQLAIANRSDVYVVFVSPQIYNSVSPDYFNPNTTLMSDKAARLLYTNLLAGQYRGYALLAERRVGDQPGVHNARYLTEWHTLPEGIFISTNKFWNVVGYANDEVMKRFFYTNTIPFPLSSSPAQNLPVIVFNSAGQLKSEIHGNQDVIIPLVRGSIFYARDATGALVPGAPDVVENSQSNSIAIFNHIRIDWVTGRARVEQAQIP